jgi:hypothetical protein
VVSVPHFTEVRIEIKERQTPWNNQHINREKWCFAKIPSVVRSSWACNISIRSLLFSKIQSVTLGVTMPPTKSENPSMNSFHNFSLSIRSRSPRREWSSELLLVWIGQSILVKKLTQHRKSIMVIKLVINRDFYQDGNKLDKRFPRFVTKNPP